MNYLDPECFETFDDLRLDLEAVEQELAARLDIRENVRAQLVSLSRAGYLDEDDLVRRWLELYSNYADWERSGGIESADPSCNPDLVLTDESFAAVVDALENPPEPTEALRELMRRDG